MRHNSVLNFKSRWPARNRHFQTIVSSLVNHKGRALIDASREMTLEAGHGVRLQGFYSPQPEGSAKGLVLLLHGWLGHAHSSYMLGAGDYLFERGYSVFRLNYRDHGGTHHLNPGMFRGDLLAEVFGAGRQIAGLEEEQPFHIVGTSMGGSFALRLAWQHVRDPMPNLVHAVAISPPINPYHTILALDQGPAIYLAYFRRAWRQAFRNKQAAFPELYPDISALINAPTSMAMTEAFVPYTPHPNATAYLNSYAVNTDMMRELQTPVTIITAADDPVIPVGDFYPLRNVSPQLEVSIQTYGGHVGFVDIFPLQTWIYQAIYTILSPD
jgi:predicted alpha/beta-fold hydrolase